MKCPYTGGKQTVVTRQEMAQVQQKDGG